MPRPYKKRSTIGSIEQRGNSYRIRWIGANGRRMSESGFASYKDADARLLDIQRGAATPGFGTTWGKYWEFHVGATLDGLQPKTAHEYRRQWKHDLEPRIGRLRVSETDWREVQRVIDDMPTASVQRHAFALWRKICNMAVRDRLLPSNPCDRSIRFKQSTTAPKVLLDAKGVMDLLGKARNTKYEPAVLLMLACGLRVEEALALDWEDIRKEEIYGATYAAADITKAVVMVGSEAVEKDSTKNEGSRRTVVIGEPFASRLLELSEGRSGAIVPNGKGGRTSPSTVSHNWKAWSERNAGQYIKLGNMRSVYATLACEAADSSLVSMVMGHSDGTTRGRNYQKSTLRGAAIVADSYGEYLLAEGARD